MLRTSQSHHAAIVAAALLLAACTGSRDGAADSGSSTSDTPLATAADSQAAHVRAVVAAGGVVDSVLPIAEQLRRFRADLGNDPDSLRGGSSSINALVERWARAVSKNDTAALTAMTLDRAEFAWVYYPGSKLSTPPYEAPPQLLWGQIQSNSDNGMRRMFAKFGNRPFRVESVECPAASDSTDRMRAFSDCAVRVRTENGPVVTARFFGSIIEARGRFKFLGYANSL